MPARYHISWPPRCPHWSNIAYHPPSTWLQQPKCAALHGTISLTPKLTFSDMPLTPVLPQPQKVLRRPYQPSRLPCQAPHRKLQAQRPLPRTLRASTIWSVGPLPGSPIRLKFRGSRRSTSWPCSHPMSVPVPVTCSVLFPIRVPTQPHRVPHRVLNHTLAHTV
jgi:hypothetical protein